MIVSSQPILHILFVYTSRTLSWFAVAAIAPAVAVIVVERSQQFLQLQAAANLRISDTLTTVTSHTLLKRHAFVSAQYLAQERVYLILGR